MSPSVPISLLPVSPGSVHLFLDAAFLLEFSFFPFYETSNEYITLMNKCNGNIGYRLVGTFLDFLPINS